MGVERPWLAHYPKSVPVEIDLSRYASVVAVIDEACVRFAQRPAYGNYGRTLSYADVDRLSARFAAYLSGTLGLVKGDRIAIMLPNHPAVSDRSVWRAARRLVVVNT
ncbi:acyl-CoA synthetase, long-chain-fatty-acid--CoA ligase, partial [mine drainage metagenome]